MQFRDLKAQYTALKEEIDNEIATVINDCNFISGMQVTKLEEQLADYVGVKHCVTCANGTDALMLALMAWNIGPGDAVFVPDFTFFASGEVVSYAGATPIFVDVCENTFNISPESLEKAILGVKNQGELQPKAIISVDLFGLPADYPKIKEIARKFNLPILEDGAQGFGGSIYGKKACSFGDISTTSFFPAKPLGCYGDGGAIFTDSTEIAYYLKSVRVHGKGTSKYDNVRIGVNSRLDTLQAAILLPKLKAFQDYELEAVNEVSERYTKLLGGIVKTPVIEEGFLSSWAQYSILLESEECRDRVQDELKKDGIPTMIYYQKPMHQQKAFSGKCIYFEELKITKMLCERVLSLPMHPYLREEDQIEIAKKIADIVKK